MKTITKFISLFFYVFLSIEIACAQANPHPELEQLASANFFVIRASSISAPQNKVLIFRSGKEVCGVKIIHHSIGSTEQKILFGDYEIRRVSLPEVDFSQAKIAHGQFDFSGYSGRSHISERKGKFFFLCGGRRVIWDYPTTFGTGAAGLFFAPTAWNDFAEVKLNDQRMKWFSADAAGHREAFQVALNKLPGDVGS